MTHEIADELFRARVDRHDKVLQRRGPFARGDQNRAVGDDDDGIFQADDADTIAVARDIGPARIDEDGVSRNGVSFRIMPRRLPHRGPGAEIRPIELGGDHSGVGSLLHNRVVEGALRRGRQRGGSERCRAAFDSSVPRRQLRRPPVRPARAGQTRARSAAVSKRKMPAFQKQPSPISSAARTCVRLFDEGIDHAGACEGDARADIAKIDRGMRRPDAEDDDRAAVRGFRRLRQLSCRKQRYRGRRDRQGRIRTLASGTCGDGSDGDGGGSVPALRFEEHRRVGNAGFGEGVFHQTTMSDAGDYHRRRKLRAIGDALQRQGEGRAAPRPAAGTASAHRRAMPARAGLPAPPHRMTGTMGTFRFPSVRTQRQ